MDLRKRLKNFQELYELGEFRDIKLPNFYEKKKNQFIENNGVYKLRVEEFAGFLLEKNLIIPVEETKEKFGENKATAYEVMFNSMSPIGEFFAISPTGYPYMKYKNGEEYFPVLYPYPDDDIKILFPYFVCMTGEMPTKDSVLKRADQFEMDGMDRKRIDDLADIVETEYVKNTISEILSWYEFYQV